MPDDDRPASVPGSDTRAPDLIFTNWREMLHRVNLGRTTRYAYAQVIERYLGYCLGNGLPVRVESARGFVDDALRRQLTGEGDTWKAALNWFFRAGRQRTAPQPEGVPSPGQVDTGKTPWQSRSPGSGIGFSPPARSCVIPIPA